MSPDWNDFDLPFGLIVPPSPEVLWPHDVWDRWVLERHAELVRAGLLRPEHNPLPRNFEALDLANFELSTSDPNGSDAGLGAASRRARAAKV